MSKNGKGMPMHLNNNSSNAHQALVRVVASHQALKDVAATALNNLQHLNDLFPFDVEHGNAENTRENNPGQDQDDTVRTPSPM